jgi:hypothetical protein
MDEFKASKLQNEVDDEIEVEPDGVELSPPPKVRAMKRETPRLPAVSLDEKRVNMGFRLAVFIVAGIYFVYAIPVLILLFQGADVDYLEFSLEVIRMLIPPLTFIFGFLFGVKKQ